MMRYRYRCALVCTLVLVAALLSPLGPFRAASVEAAGIALRPPFNGTYRITTFFDHHYPNYGDDNEVTVYTGESTPDCKIPGTYCYEGHPGYDWGLPRHTAVLAAADGTVVAQGASGDWGVRVVIQHNGSYYTTYAHLENPTLVQVGQTVMGGEQIAWSDNTGHSEGDHLHFQVYRGGYDNNNYATDPFGWRGSGPDPLLNWPSPGQAHTAECLWRGLPGDAISCFDHIVEDHYPVDGGGWSHGDWWGTVECGNGWWSHWTNSETYRSSWAQWNSQAGGFNAVRHHGYYRVSAWVPASTCVSSKSAQAKYRLYYYPNQVAPVTINQSAVNDNWANLGTFQLDAGYSYRYVDLDDYTGDGHGTKKVAADSLKFSAELTYLPTIKRDGNWTTYVDIRNLSASQAANVTLNWYYNNGSFLTYTNYSVPANGRTIVTSPANWTGSAVVVSDQDVAIVNQRQDNYPNQHSHQSYSGFIGGGSAVYAPFAANCWISGNYRYRTCSHVQNVGRQAVTINTLNGYFWDTGAPAAGGTQAARGPGRVAMFYVPAEGVPASFKGSARATGTLSTIAGIHNYARGWSSYPCTQGEADDYGASYNLPQR